jgi:hypothetical protein
MRLLDWLLGRESPERFSKSVAPALRLQESRHPSIRMLGSAIEWIELQWDGLAAGLAQSNAEYEAERDRKSEKGTASTKSSSTPTISRSEVKPSGRPEEQFSSEPAPMSPRNEDQLHEEGDRSIG